MDGSFAKVVIIPETDMFNYPISTFILRICEERLRKTEIPSHRETKEHINESIESEANKTQRSP